jgi:DNA-binding winged helix-turn-helix (wHTH) protein
VVVSDDHSSASFQLADWLVEPKLNCITKDGKVRHLEPKVMKVLVELASHPNQLLSKEELIEAVWPNTFIGDDVLTRCISVLRRVMDDTPQAARFIQTIPKAGYRLVAEVHPVPSEPAGLPAIPKEAPLASPATTSNGGAFLHKPLHLRVSALPFSGLESCFSR